MTAQDKRYDEYRRKCAEVDEHKWNTYIRLKSEPKSSRYCLVKTDDGKIEIAHHARNLSGEEQPAFEGWLPPEGDSSCFIEVEGTVVEWAELPTYLDDASIDAVVRKLDYNQTELYCMCLMCDAHRMVKATPEQKAEALCRTLLGEPSRELEAKLSESNRNRQIAENAEQLLATELDMALKKIEELKPLAGWGKLGKNKIMELQTRAERAENELKEAKAALEHSELENTLLRSHGLKMETRCLYFEEQMNEIISS